MREREREGREGGRGGDCSSVGSLLETAATAGAGPDGSYKLQPSLPHEQQELLHPSSTASQAHYKGARSEQKQPGF